MADRSLPPLRLLTVFEAVLRSGSFKKAAAELNVTQPAISQALKALEEDVGIQLLDRSTRPATVTPAGRILETGVLEGLGRVADAVGQVRALTSIAQTSVTIACSIGTATYWLMPRLAGFYAEHPSIAVNVMTTVGTPELTGGLDLLIMYGTGNWRDVRSVKLFDEKVVPVCSPALAADPAIGGGLATATLLHVVGGDKAWLTWDDYFEQSGLPKNRGQGRYFTNYVQATQAALSGQGIMLGWESNTGDLVREGRLVAANDIPLHPKDAFFLAIPERREETEARRLFVDWIGRLTKPA